MSKHDIPRVDSQADVNKRTSGNRNFVLKAPPHEPDGTTYVVVTDQTDPVYLQPLQELAKFHGGSIVHVDNLGDLPKNEAARKQLTAELISAKPRFVAIAPRLENFRENTQLALWEVFSSLDSSKQVAVYPGWLIAPNATSFSALISRSIHFSPYKVSNLRPMVVAQLPGPKMGGTRAVSKAALMQDYFHELGLPPIDALIVRTPPSIRAGLQTPKFDALGDVITAESGPIAELSKSKLDQLSKANLLLMFGHGLPGMTCSLSVKALRDVAMENKIVLCGSCYSAVPAHSDFDVPPEQTEDAQIKPSHENAHEQFAGLAIANGATVVYGQMRVNGGFPEMYPVLEGLLAGRTLGESYQRLINCTIKGSGLASDKLVVAPAALGNDAEVNRRNELLYVVIGDPALRPIAP